MIEVHQWLIAGKPSFIEFYDSWKDFFRCYCEITIKENFGHVHHQRIHCTDHYWCCNGVNVGAYVKIASIGGVTITPDAIVGLWRKYQPVREKLWKQATYRRRQGKTNRAYGTYRSPQFNNERKQNIIVDEMEPKIRKSRMDLHNLDPWWDGFPSHNEKNWKRHRKTQWK